MTCGDSGRSWGMDTGYANRLRFCPGSWGCWWWTNSAWSMANCGFCAIIWVAPLGSKVSPTPDGQWLLGLPGSWGLRVRRRMLAQSGSTEGLYLSSSTILPRQQVCFLRPTVQQQFLSHFLQSIRRKYSCGWVQQPSFLSNKLQMITVYFNAFRIPLLVTVVSCHLLAGKSPAHMLCLWNEPLPLWACLNVLFILQFFFGLEQCSGLWAAETTHVSNPAAPAFTGEKIVLNSIYFQVDKNQRGLQGEGKDEALQISVFFLHITYLLKPVRHN